MALSACDLLGGRDGSATMFHGATIFVMGVWLPSVCRVTLCSFQKGWSLHTFFGSGIFGKWDLGWTPYHAVPLLTFASFCTVWSRLLSRSLHRCTPSNPSTISPIEILLSDLLVEWNEFGQYWRRCVERCDWIFQAILLTSTVRWAWIHDGYKSGWAPALAVGVFKKESISCVASLYLYGTSVFQGWVNG